MLLMRENATFNQRLPHSFQEFRERFGMFSVQLASLAGGSWPQVMLPGGFEGALTFGDYGFGSVVVDATGIVRAVGVHGFNIESTIDEVLKQ